MPLIFGRELNGGMYALRVTSAGHLYVNLDGWLTGGTQLHTDANGDLYVRPADWYSTVQYLNNDGAGNLFIRLDESLAGATKIKLHTGGAVIVRPEAFFTNAATLHNDADGDLYVRPADWFSGAATQLLDANGRTIIKSTGLVGGAQQADPIRFGYSAAIYRTQSNTNIPSATYDLDDSAVPAGEIWVITNIAIGYTGTAPTYIQASIVNSSTGYLLYRLTPPVSQVFYDRQGWFVLGPGDNLRVGCVGGTVGDDLFIRASGFRVDIDQ